MSIQDQVKSFTEDIEASHETRIAVVADLARETHQMLGNFRRERKKVAGDLRRSLASDRARRTSQVQRMRTRNNKDLKDMSRELKKMVPAVAEFLSAAEKERSKEFAALLKEIKGVVAGIEEDTAKTLADFRSERQEMAKALKASLAGDTRVRVETVHELLSGFAKEHEAMASSLRSELSAFQRNLSQSVDTMLADFSIDHRQSRAHLGHMAKEMAAKRAGKSAPTPAAAIATPAPVKTVTASKSEGNQNTSHQNTSKKQTEENK